MKLPSEFQIGDRIILTGKVSGIIFNDGQVTSYNLLLDCQNGAPILVNNVPQFTLQEDKNPHTKTDKDNK